MKLHLPCRLRRAVVRALFAAATVVTTLASSTYADMITPDGRTATQVIQSGNVYDVYTNTVRGNTGFNSFSTFDVYADTTANLHLADGTGKLINVVRDSASHIDGVLNSYKDGSIGGDVYFLNPNGIIVGKSGVINVGSISMSTPTAAFVEQLIARDGSISATATQAVLAGDMPINEKGTISIKGKVNAARTAKIRAGKAEVKDGEINAGVKLSEMVNTGNRKLDTQGMTIRDGKLSFGGSPAKESKAAEPEVEPEVEPEEETTAGTADISIFADSVLLDSSALNADSVYIAPEEATINQMSISGDYFLEGSNLYLSDITVKAGERLSSFIIAATTAKGQASITLSKINISADIVSITATTAKDEAAATITLAEKNDIKATLTEDGGLSVYAASMNGNASVDISSESTLSSASDVLIAAATGAVSSKTSENTGQIVLTPIGSGDASVTVAGKVEAKSGALEVTSTAVGNSGNATIGITGKLTSMGTAERKVGDLGFDRRPELIVDETDTPEKASHKNAQYSDEYAKHLNNLQSATAAVGTIGITARSAEGDASVALGDGKALPTLASSLSASINADAAKNAGIQLEGTVNSGDISAEAVGASAVLSVKNSSTALIAASHQKFVQNGTVVSVEKSNGAITLEAGTRNGSQPGSGLAENGNAQLEVAGGLYVSRGRYRAGDAGDISLVSSGSLTIADTAQLRANAGNGQGGTIYLDAADYHLSSSVVKNCDVSGADPNRAGTIWLMNNNVLTDINDADEAARRFLKEMLGLTEANAEARYWNSGFTLVNLSGDIQLSKDVTATVRNFAIEDGTHIYGNGHSLTLTNSALHLLSVVNMIHIGNNVTIEGMKDFTFKFRKKSVTNTLVPAYAFSPVSLTVGDDFRVSATGNVSITMEGFGNTYITFGKGVDIQAGGGCHHRRHHLERLGWIPRQQRAHGSGKRHCGGDTRRERHGRGRRLCEIGSVQVLCGRFLHQFVQTPFRLRH